ncbi:cystathionine beta-lyase [Altererythrobacter sp. ZODW24]|uniref:cystathionine beta-lyase n=1 Tax=Altererythrobacter sp. ZODW24 TaxID=2185142 RepID=UPI000DF7AB32|nr:cystathionine beta-lyase [Altererythrobacter sp. ZODW24]
MSNNGADKKAGTRLVGAGRKPEWTGAVVNPPVWRASTHLYENCAALKEGTQDNADGRFFYGRRGAPTQWALADALTELEPCAFGTVLYPSGVAAISGALMSVLSPGNTLLVTDNAYEPSRLMANGLFKRLGVETRYFDPLDLNAYRALFCENTKAVLIESPGSLTMEVCDTPALAAIAREHGAVSMIDNTWATPLGFPALQHGCDMAIMALTKHVGGHSDLMMGSVSAGERLYKRLRQTAQTLGHVVSPDDAALALRGLRTLELRLQKQTSTALKIAEWLQKRGDVAHVLCPMLPGSSDYDLWERDFAGACGLFSFVLKGRDADARARLIDALELFGIGYSWGGFESLALPANPAPIRSAAKWPPEGYEANDKQVIRLSIGLEDADDLIADLSQAFDVMGPA